MNHLLDARTLLISAKKSWEILLNSWDFEIPATLTREARDAFLGCSTNWLPLYNKIRTHFQNNTES
ncbi:hypothetical protein A2456_00880 [Candidatus Nomurabacteria bacterium RIFOXYC2_FULL_36_19]|uniref:Uncharacterized protein n=1 Tax=Candidatus Nomurabacteria bacterium RIFOXYC2_FULL_36_19 TaxID=1801806 RepID=A0A1F6YSA1_9BACT|nr:MAG: hypothetical protein A2238_03480 [Candidatus Nomurabacteria bacterium RIFOXYA2_FULL_35_9]OGJ09259.1 MAG: hypothetical protein A2456_00880 [Candidatus Nomurabacteria bacterium RIFOXYC2_FULL_36_19]